MDCNFCGASCSPSKYYRNKKKEFNIHSLMIHISRIHKISAKEYYDKFLKTENEGYCLNCTAPTKFKSNVVGYLKFCCKRCATQYQWRHNDKFRTAMKELQSSLIYKVSVGKKIAESWKNKDIREKRIKGSYETLRNNYINFISFNGKEPNKCEQKVLTILESIDSDWIFTGDGSKPIANKWPDFVNENKKLIIEFLGTYWHRNETKQDRQNRTNLFKLEGYKTLYVWDFELGNIEGLNYKLKEYSTCL